ncbi:hypothetical protein HYC85_029126 [Camellia sinensis]|uniref:Reverse transcriptase Ty1/copia-type domain-containing protein n=1 Tax=Camellia sinensis TaxID=4442 RepID=A0A7J7FX83_CAMSI|nr:hypothetical protein HYC85_029126 [Camellia sinensis]
MSSMAWNQVWQLVDFPPRPKSIGNKWVLKVKRKVDVSKVRLMAKGYTQREGIDILPDGICKGLNRTCTAESEDASMVVLEGKTFLFRDFIFLSPSLLQLLDTIIAPNSPKACRGRNLGWWLTFQDVNGLDVSGPGKIDGRGIAGVSGRHLLAGSCLCFQSAVNGQTLEGNKRSEDLPFVPPTANLDPQRWNPHKSAREKPGLSPCHS